MGWWDLRRGADVRRGASVHGDGRQVNDRNARDVGHQPTGAVRSQPLLWLAGSVLLVAALWSRLAGLDQSLFHDEAHTALRYVAGGPAAILGAYYVPNDHVLFNLLAWATTGLLGDSAVVLRLWSVVPALAGIALAGGWAWRRLGPLAGLVAAGLIVAAPVHLLLSRMARGYGLAFLLTTVVGVAAVAWLREAATDRRVLAVLLGAGVLAAWTLPHLALPAGAMAAVALLVRGHPRRWWLLAGTAVAMTLPYVHRLPAVLAQSEQEIVADPAWYAALMGWFTDLVLPTFAPRGTIGINPAGMLPSDPVGIAAAVVGGVLATVVAGLGVIRLERLARGAGAALVAGVAGMYVVPVLAGVDLADRFASPALPLVALLLGAGVAETWARLDRPGRTALAVVLAGVTVIAAISAFRFARPVIALPLEELRGASRAAAAAWSPTAGPILLAGTAPTGFAHYLDDIPIESATTAELRQRVCADPRPVVVIAQPGRPGAHVPQDCLAARDAVRQRFVSRPERGRYIDVWRVPSGRSGQ